MTAPVSRPQTPQSFQRFRGSRNDSLGDKHSMRVIARLVPKPTTKIEKTPISLRKRSEELLVYNTSLKNKITQGLRLKRKHKRIKVLPLLASEIEKKVSDQTFDMMRDYIRRPLPKQSNLPKPMQLFPLRD